MPNTKTRAILASPLLHFFLVGGLVFGAYSLMNPASEQPTENVLRLSEIDAQRLVTEFAAARHRLPTPDEVRGLIHNWAVEEASVREALALGLDQGDAMIRNRLRSKIEFLAEAPAAALTPDDATLEAFYQANAMQFSQDGELSFEQVLLPPGAEAQQARAVKVRLEAGADPASLSASAMLPSMVEAMPLQAVERIFGAGFGYAVASLPPETWAGPVQSGFGEHMVLLHERHEGALPPIDMVRDRVLASWRADEARKMREAYLQNLLMRYRLELPTIPDEDQP